VTGVQGPACRVRRAGSGVQRLPCSARRFAAALAGFG